MVSTGKSFRATEQVAYLFKDLLEQQFSQYRFSLALLPYHERGAIFYYDIQIDAPICPEEVRKFIDVYLGRLFPAQSQDYLKDIEP